MFCHVIINFCEKEPTVYGFTPRKSWDGCITDQRLLNSRHFWRGMIDGDGSIGYRKRDGYPLLSLVGTKIMIDQFRYFIYKEKD